MEEPNKKPITIGFGVRASLLLLYCLLLLINPSIQDESVVLKILQETQAPPCLQIFGEAYSGAPFLRQAVLSNFGVGLCNLSSSHTQTIQYEGGELVVATGNNVFSIAIVRHPIDWFMAMGDEARGPLSYVLKSSSMMESVQSLWDPSKDRNQIVYARLDQARLILQVLPSVFPNFLLVKYEDLVENYDSTLTSINRRFGLQPKTEGFNAVSNPDEGTGRESWTYKDRQYMSCICNEVVRLADAGVEASWGYTMQCPSLDEKGEWDGVIRRFVVVGQRQSGIDIVRHAMEESFELMDASDDLRYRHLLGKVCLGNVDDVLFISLARDPIQWMVSLFYHPKTVSLLNRKRWWYFFFHTFDLEDSEKQLRKYNNDTNSINHISLRTRYRNIFQMRAVETSYMLETLPKKFKHHALITYESFVTDPGAVLAKLQENFSLRLRKDALPVQKFTSDNLFLEDNGPYQVEPCLIDTIRPMFSEEDEEREGRLGYDLHKSLFAATKSEDAKVEIPITQFSTLGERCSGTNFLTSTMLKNFEVNETLIQGWKHFFGSRECMPFSEDTLFIAIVRDPVQWLLSFYRERHHLDKTKIGDLASFLTMQVVSYANDEKLEDHPFLEIPEDRTFYSRRRYEDVFELRAAKALFFLDHLPKRVRHSVVIRYEDLRDHYDEVLQMLHEKFKLRYRAGISINATSYRNHDQSNRTQNNLGGSFVKVDSYKGVYGRYKRISYSLTSRPDADVIVPLMLCKIDQEVEERLGYGDTIRDLQNNLSTTFPAPVDWSASCRSKIIPSVTAITDIL